MTVSPLAPPRFPDLPPIAGVQFAAVAAGVRYKNRDDVMLATLAPGTAIAGVFTKSATRSAPVLDCQQKLGQEFGQELGGADAQGAAILVNAGNANAFTGRHGQEAVAELVAAVAAKTGVPDARVFTASTGVIGEKLPSDRILAHLDDLADRLTPDAMAAAASAIMTTDTFPKGACTDCSIDGTPIRIAGFAKGSGMIAPDMATMLVYIFTDAKIAQSDLQALLGRLVDTTFNNITVDSDTSTSDTLMLCATGQSGVDVTGSSAFDAALTGVMLDLAHQVVRDGEGATKFVEITVSGARNAIEAKTHALSVANSPLVKTAIAGEDPNWGRIVMAIGKSGAAADRDRLSIRFGDILVAEQGWVADSYAEADGAAYMKNETLNIAVDVGMGDGTATVWTCDLTHGYISINADYRS